MGEAREQMPPETEANPKIIPGASHLFEEGGTLEQAARLTRDWFIAIRAAVYPS